MELRQVAKFSGNSFWPGIAGLERGHKLTVAPKRPMSRSVWMVTEIVLKEINYTIYCTNTCSSIEACLR